MKKPKSIPKKSPRKERTPKAPKILKEQIPAKPKSKKVIFWVMGAALFAIIFIGIGLFLGRQSGIAESNSENPLLMLKDYNAEPEEITKSMFEKALSNGNEIFDWMLKNDYFQEKSGTSVHPRFITPDEKFNLKNKYPAAYEIVLTLLQQADARRHQFVIKSAEISRQMVDRAWAALEKKNIPEAINDCKTSIDLFPMNAQCYILLTKLYLMTGQEPKMFEMLTLAGRSYPNFNNIVSVIDDTNLDNIPLDQPQDSIFLANFPENKRMAISFMYDDGEKSIYVNALPILDKYGFKATIPIVAGMVAQNDDDPFWGSWDDWRDAVRRGFEIANHSMYHRDSKDLHGSDFDLSVDQAKELIEKNIGHKVTAYIFPHDSYTDEAVGRALRSHEVVRTGEFLSAYYNRTVGIVYGGPNFSLETANRLIDIGIKRHLWILGNCHGVTTKHGILSFKSITPDFLDKHLSYIHSKSKDIWVDTFTNVFEYLRLRKQTKIETKGFSNTAMDFVLHSDTPGTKLLSPLTVVLKVPAGADISSAQATSAHKLKTWPCDTDELCVDVDSYEDNVHVQWGR